MGTLFKEGQIIFVDPDCRVEAWRLCHCPSSGRAPRNYSLQTNRIFRKPPHTSILLNPVYENLLLTKQDKVWGKVVRLTKSLWRIFEMYA